MNSVDKNCHLIKFVWQTFRVGTTLGQCVPELKGMNYWERLERLAMNSEQRRLERYQIIYVWKVIHGVAPNCGIKWTGCEERRGRMCEIKPIRGKSLAQNLRRQSFQVAGPKLWNCLRNGNFSCSVFFVFAFIQNKYSQKSRFLGLQFLMATALSI